LDTGHIEYYIVSLDTDGDPQLRCTLHGFNDVTRVQVIGSSVGELGDGMLDLLTNAAADAGIDVGL